MNPNPYEPLDARVHDREPSYQSDAEARIGGTLDRHDIPYFYRQPKLVLDQGRFEVYYPCFALPAHGGLAVDYAGAPDIWDAGIRQRVYELNRIPSVIVSPYDLTGLDWPDRLAARILAAASTAMAGKLEPTEPPWQEIPVRRIPGEYQRAWAEYRTCRFTAMGMGIMDHDDG